MKFSWPDVPAIVGFFRKEAVSLVLVLVLALTGYLVEEHKVSSFPWLIDLQSQTLNFMTWADPRVRRADRVTVIEIDDATYRARGLDEPTDRSFVASLVRAAARADAAVVMLDLDLVHRTSDDKAGARKTGDAKLLEAIRDTEHRVPPIPVIVPIVIIHTNDGLVENQNVYKDADLPAIDASPNMPVRAPVGFASEPRDLLQIPLLVDAYPHDPNANGDPNAHLPNLETYWSLSLRTADAYDSALDIAPAASLQPAINAAILDGEFVYGTFLPASAFLHVSANDVANGSPAALAALQHRIVLIGGVRHEQTTGELEDVHDTPLGPMIGVYKQANWIEAILDGRTKRPVPWWVAWVVDLTLGFSMVVLSARARTLSDQLGLVVLFLIPIVVGYIAFVDLAYSLDFALPLLVLMAHLLLDKYREFGHRKEPEESAEVPVHAD